MDQDTNLDMNEYQLNNNTVPNRQTTAAVPMTMLAGNNAVVYPEIYYKVQPHILMACDQLDALGVIPTKELLENAADMIHDDIMNTHPEMAEQYGDQEEANQDMMPEAQAAVTYGYGSGRGYGQGYGRGYGSGRGRGRGYGYRGRRNRGGLRDLIDILLMGEYYRRRRYRSYY